MKIQKCIGILSVLFISACSTTGPVKIYLPHNELDSPEASGKTFDGRADVGVRNLQRIVLTRNYGTTTMVSAKPDIDTFTTLGADGELGLLKRLDFSLKISGIAPALAQFKYQLIGTPRRDAGEGNYSLSLAAAYGSSEQSGSGSSGKYTFNSQNQWVPTDHAEYNLSQNLYKVSLISGYRVTETELLYGGISGSFLDYSGSQVLLDGARTTIKTSAQQQILFAGMIASTKFMNREGKKRPFQLFGQLELDGARFRTGHTSKITFNGALNAGIYW